MIFSSSLAWAGSVAYTPTASVAPTAPMAQSYQPLLPVPPSPPLSAPTEGIDWFALATQIGIPLLKYYLSGQSAGSPLGDSSFTPPSALEPSPALPPVAPAPPHPTQVASLPPPFIPAFPPAAIGQDDRQQSRRPVPVPGASNAPATSLTNLSPGTSGNFAFDSVLNSLHNRKSPTARICRTEMENMKKRGGVSLAGIKPLPDLVNAVSRYNFSEERLRYALQALQDNKNLLGNDETLTLVDFDRRSNKERMLVLNLRTGTVRAYKATHGSGSGGHAAAATRFSDRDGSHQSSLGCAITGGIYSGQHGRSLRLHGIEPGRNGNMCPRTIVVHAAKYAASGGRSWGCLAVEPRKRDEIINQIKGGSLVCSFGTERTQIASRNKKIKKSKKSKKSKKVARKSKSRKRSARGW